MEVFNLQHYKNSRNFLKQAPEILYKLNECDKMLVKYCIYPPVYKLLRIVRDTKLIIEANMRIAENTIKNKGKLK